jgi:hypothetical protein
MGFAKFWPKLNKKDTPQKHKKPKLKPQNPKITPKTHEIET